MSSIESRADENSNRLNLGTSRDSTEGTVDRLNEAPRYPDFELVQVHLTTGDCAEVTIRDKHNRLVYSGMLCMVDNPGQYYPPDYWRDGQPG